MPLDVATQLALSLGVGLFAGFEREWSRKDLGARAVALTSGRALLLRQGLEITTSVSFVIDFVLGVLIGLGHLFTPVAAAILLTLILSLKSEFSSFAGLLRPEEIRSAVLLG